MRSPILVPALVALLALSGCEDNGGPGDGPVAFEDYCAAYAAMACDVAERCDCLGGYSVDLCLTYERMQCQDDVEDPVRSGLRTYDAGAAGRCLDGLWDVAHDCVIDGNDEYPSACDSMLQGTVAETGACDGDGDCLPGLECWNDACVRMPTTGQACLPGEGCASGHYCGQDGLCHGYQGHGGPCPEGDLACASDLYCDDRVGTCEPYLATNESCAHASWACADDLYCSDAAGEVCRPYPGAGGDCADSYSTCADGYYCGADDLCHAQLPDGSPCTGWEECRSEECTNDICVADTSTPDVCPF